MKLTRKQKDRIINVLLLARPRIDRKTETFICDAIANNFLVNDKDHALATKYINWLLADAFSVCCWLKNCVGVEGTEEDYRAYRLRWIDHMINELKK